MSAVLFFIAAIGALTGAIGVVMLRNPFYNVLALVVHLIALAALFLLLRAEFVAAAQVVVYAGAVMVLYVFVVAYIGGADEPAAATRRRRAAGARPAVRAGAGRRAVHRAARLGTEGHLGPGRALRARVRDAQGDRHACSSPRTCSRSRSPRCCCWSPPIGAVVLARRRRGLEARRGLDAGVDHARARLHGHHGRDAPGSAPGFATEPETEPDRRPAPARRARRAAGSGDRLVPGRLGADLLHRRRRRAHAAQPAGHPALPGADAQRRQPGAGRLLAACGAARTARSSP